MKGRFAIHCITKTEGQFKLCKIVKQSIDPKGVPFIVTHNGKWAFNDPQYPFSLIFTPTDSPSVSTPFLFPVANGVRNIVLTFSPGCPSNTYQYTLQKVN